MTTTLQIPAAPEVGRFLTNLFGLEIKVADSTPLTAESICAIAQYVDDNGTVHNMIACDLAGAAKLGAGLTQIPMGGVEDTLKSGKLPENIAENLGEVFNILVNLFPESHAHRLVIGKVVLGPEAATIFSQQTAANQASFQLDIQRYGKGNIVIG